jgi:predicted PhzF superfamily epimerase YddE/YHI9
MQYPIHVIDAFASARFAGNPAAVVLFDRYPDDSLLQSIAAENNLAETAYPVPLGDGRWELRWFTPTVEVPLCGHATLASAHVLFESGLADQKVIEFVTRKSGSLFVRRDGAELSMDFPANPGEAVDEDLRGLFGEQPDAVLKTSRLVMAVLDSADAVRNFAPDRLDVLKLDRGGLIVTAPGDQGHDCVSRFFAPAHGIDEDSVTGSAHTMIAPYWATRLGKPDVRAFQASARGGLLLCRVAGNRVVLRGTCVPYLKGEIEV